MNDCSAYLYIELVKVIKEEAQKIMSAITDFAAQVKIQFDAVNANLDNINADIQNLDKQIQDLKDQLANSGLSPADQAALDAVVAASTALSTKSKGIADATPDLPPPPPPAPGN